MSLVSIIMPTYNRGHCLERAITSVINQTYHKWELIIVDNNSTDDTDKIISSFNDSRIRLLKINNNGVIAASRNLGIDAASGEYLAFLDSDDWWHSQKLDISISHLRGGADIVYHDLYLVSSYPPKKRLYKKAKTRALTENPFEELLQGGNVIVTSSVLVRRALFEKINGFSEEESLIAAEDFDAWIRLCKFTNKFVRIDQTLGYYWWGSGNTDTPEREIKKFGFFSELYGEDIQKICGEKYPFWLAYSLGTANYRLGDFDRARFYFKLVFSNSPSLNIFLRAATRYIMTLIFSLKKMKSLDG